MGGYVYRGAKGSLSWGAYVYGIFGLGAIYMLESGVQTLLLVTTPNIVSFGEDEAGELYVVNDTGTIQRIANVTPSSCSPVISPMNQAFLSEGGTGSVTVTVSSECNWIATSNVSWITITSGSSGIGTGTVSYSVSANTTTIQKTVTMTIAGETFTVTQAGASTSKCSTWDQVISKYQVYVSGSASWSDVISCYSQYAS
jgi:hypothetical protein